MLSLVNTAYGTGTFIGPALVALTGGYSIVFGVVGVGVLGCVLFLGRAEDEIGQLETLHRRRSAAGPSDSCSPLRCCCFVYEGLEAGVGHVGGDRPAQHRIVNAIRRSGDIVVLGCVHRGPRRHGAACGALVAAAPAGARIHHQRRAAVRYSSADSTAAAVRAGRPLRGADLPGRGLLDDQGDPQRDDADDLRDPRCGDRECPGARGARCADRARGCAGSCRSASPHARSRHSAWWG